MKLTITRKVVFKNLFNKETGRAINKSDSIINQYVLEGELEDIQHLWLSMIEELKNEFSQVKEIVKR